MIKNPQLYLLGDKSIEAPVVSRVLPMSEAFTVKQRPFAGFLLEQSGILTKLTKVARKDSQLS